MLAATQAGIAFSNASVALVHGMSRPLGAHFHIPHGLSNAMLLPAVTAFSVEAALDRYAECARTMGVAQAHDTDQSAVDRLIDGLYKRNAELQVPSPKQFGIAEEEYFALLGTMAAQALASGSPQNNPRIPSAKRSRRSTARCGNKQFSGATPDGAHKYQRCQIVLPAPVVCAQKSEETGPGMISEVISRPQHDLTDF